MLYIAKKIQNFEHQKFSEMKKSESIPTCDFCVHSSIFRSLNKDDIGDLAFEKSCNYYKRGDIIYHEGNRLSGVYCINKGIVKIYKTGIDGKEQILKFAKPGDIIAFRSIISNEPACTSGKVIEDAVLCFIPTNRFYSLLKEYPEFSLDLMRISCKELGDANKFILDIAQKNVRERLAEVLLLLKDEFGLDDKGILQVTLTREELANIVGTATESVIRLLSEFKADKLIELSGRKIRLLNTGRLQKISEVF
jgi:CRP-like cAMP-binding protein